MRSQHHQHPGPGNHTHDEAGRVDGPALLYGGIGLVLAVGMQMIGLFKKGDVRLKNAMLDPVFHGAAPDQLSLAVLVVFAAVFCFGMAFAVLDSAGTWRRVILGVSALVIVLAMVPTFAVWNIYFSPFLPAIGIFWTWFCTMMYVNHHVMPCDLLNSDFRMPSSSAKAVDVELTPVITATQAVEGKPDASNSAKKKTPTKRKKSQDPDAKYKPKGLDND